MKKQKLSIFRYYISMAFLISATFIGASRCGVEQVENYRRKAMQIEAKLALKNIKTLQENYFTDHQKHSHCIDEFVNSRKSDDYSKYYVGFKVPNADLSSCQEATTISVPNSKRTISFDHLPYFNESKVTDNSFTAVAAAKLCDDCPIDVWTINEKNELINIQLGLKTNYEWIFPTLIMFVIIYMMIRRRKLKKKLSDASSS